MSETPNSRDLPPVDTNPEPDQGEDDEVKVNAPEPEEEGPLEPEYQDG